MSIYCIDHLHSKHTRESFFDFCKIQSSCFFNCMALCHMRKVARNLKKVSVNLAASPNRLDLAILVFQLPSACFRSRQ